MKILHVVPSIALKHGGVSASVRQLCLGLAETGLEISLWTTPRGTDPAADPPADDRLTSAGVALRYFPVHPWKNLGERYAYSPALKTALLRESSHFDLLHLHALWQYPSWAASRACIRSGTPYIVSPCGMLDPYGFRRHSGFKRLYGLCLERTTLSRAAAIHFTSPQEERLARRWAVPTRSAVIPRSIDLEESRGGSSDPFVRSPPEWTGRRLLIFMGRLHRKKRLDIVLELFRRLAQRHADIHLVIAGHDDGEGSFIHRFIERWALGTRVTLTGPVWGAQKWALLRNGFAFLLPSEDENFGVAALEASAAGLPVLLSPGVALSHWVARSEAGLILQPQISLWADSLEHLLENPEEARRMGDSGRRMAESQFTRPVVCRAMRHLYEEVLSQ